MECYAGVDIGGTWVRVLLANETRILRGVSQLTEKRGTERAIGEQLKRLTRTVLAKADVGADSLKGIGVSSCGPFKGMVSLEDTPNICDSVNNWHVIPIIEPLKEEFGEGLRYRLENDAKAAALAENLFGAAQGERNCAYLTISTGIGGGFIIDGMLCEGKNGNAAHVGHMIVVPDGPKCGCGQRGCLEALVSGGSIARRAREGIESEAGRGSIMRELCGQDLKNLTAKEVFDAARLGDPLANRIVEETVKYLGIGVINVINVTDAAVVVLGGAVMANHDLILEPLRRYVKENSFAAISRGTEIRLSKLGRFVGTVAGLSLVVPGEWIREWSKIKPWEKVFEEEQL
ncbi:MAG: ROK family protein [Candidatus Brockarchaeota archaeon]|nr:ROK family protein [Candidatus Brockarchaeota archaeon]